MKVNPVQSIVFGYWLEAGVESVPASGGGEVPALPPFEPAPPGEVGLLTENEIVRVEPASLKEGFASSDARCRLRAKARFSLVKLTTILLIVSCSCPEESCWGEPASAVIELPPSLHVENLGKSHAHLRARFHLVHEVPDAGGGDLHVVIQEDEILGLHRS